MEKKMSVAPQETILGLIGGFWIARSIYLAAQIGIADYFEDAPVQLNSYKSPSFAFCIRESFVPTHLNP